MYNLNYFKRFKNITEYKNYISDDPLLPDVGFVGGQGIRNRKKYYMRKYSGGGPSVLVVRLRVNGSRTPSDIDGYSEGFEITTRPTDKSKSYSIYVNGERFVTTCGDYRGIYECSINSGETKNLFTVTSDVEVINLWQKPIEFTPNLKVNGSSESLTIGSAVTAFTITTEPNLYRETTEYTIYVNNEVLVTTAGTYSYVYECGANPEVNNRTYDIRCDNDRIVVTQGYKAIVPNLKVNGSTTPENIGSAVTSFTISTDPNILNMSYDILVDGDVVKTVVGSYSFEYECGPNPSLNDRTIVVSSANEIVELVQNAKEFIPSLKVNGSITPGAIGSGVTSFTITTEPNGNDKVYAIKVNGVTVVTTSGNCNYAYNCGVNPESYNKTFVVTCEEETVEVIQVGNNFTVNLLVNGKKTVPVVSVDGSDSAFTITTEVNDSNILYTIYVNNVPFVSTNGNYSGIYVCGVNPMTEGNRQFSVSCVNETVVASQGSGPIRINLKVNGSTTPDNIGSAVTSFTITTEPNTHELYVIYVNDKFVTGGTTDLTYTYVCGENDTVEEREFIVTVDMSEESVTIKQDKINFEVVVTINNEKTHTIDWDTEWVSFKTQPSHNTVEYDVYKDGAKYVTRTGRWQYDYYWGENNTDTPRTIVLSCCGDTATAIQNAKEFTPNLEINNSTSPENIRGKATRFNITVQPNVEDILYNIYVNNNPIGERYGRTDTMYTIGQNPSYEESRTFVVKVANETVSITQDPNVFIPYLSVNGSSLPDNLTDSSTVFSITTYPALDLEHEYTIYVNNVPFVTTKGVYEGFYTCGANTSYDNVRTFVVRCETEEVTLTQNCKPFVSNLKVNGSTTPENIGSAVTEFTVSTEPEYSAHTYNIYVNDEVLVTTAGTYSGKFICGKNPTDRPRTFVVECGDSSVSIIQDKSLFEPNLTVNGSKTPGKISSGVTNILIETNPTVKTVEYVIYLDGVAIYTGTGDASFEHTIDRNPIILPTKTTRQLEVTCGIEKVTVTQTERYSKPNLKVNNSTGPTIAWDASGFTMTTTPEPAYSDPDPVYDEYNIYLDDVAREYCPLSGNVSENFTVEKNMDYPGQHKWTFKCEKETVVVTQDNYHIDWQFEWWFDGQAMGDERQVTTNLNAHTVRFKTTPRVKCSDGTYIKEPKKLTFTAYVARFSITSDDGKRFEPHWIFTFEQSFPGDVDTIDLTVPLPATTEATTPFDGQWVVQINNGVEMCNITFVRQA